MDRERREVPNTKHQTSNGIDNFLFARLEREGLSPAAEADRRALARRLHFDLTGLPPTPETVEAFVKDTGANAYEKLVDQLLAGEHYGERMATYWLDLVRYADTVGYHGDQDHHASPYRDYVIDAFNTNLPFDRFTREQLAGDLLPKPTTDQLTEFSDFCHAQRSRAPKGSALRSTWRALPFGARLRCA